MLFFQIFCNLTILQQSLKLVKTGWLKVRLKPKSRRENHELSYKPIICQSTAFLGWRWIQRVSTFILQHCSRCWSVPLRHPQCWILGQHWKTVLFALKWAVLSAIRRFFFLFSLFIKLYRTVVLNFLSESGTLNWLAGRQVVIGSLFAVLLLTLHTGQKVWKLFWYV